MRSLLTITFSLLALFAFSTCSFADVIDNSGGGFAIPDNDTNGFSTTIFIADSELITDVDVTLAGISHTFVGDLIVRISSPNGTTADLFNRTGIPIIAAGSNANLGGTYTFSDGGDDWSSEAFSTSNSGIMFDGTYEASGFSDVAVSLATAFGTENTAGTWTLSISDNSSGDSGTLTSWGLNITSTAVPEPGSIAVFGLLGLGLAMRRKRTFA